MRNLKKFLALVLAMMMVFGLMVTVNASTFTDAANVTDAYTEGVDIMQAIGVLKGYGNGSLRPGENVLRQEYAAILYRIHSGDVDDVYRADYAQYAAGFEDVDVNSWYAGYIGYCYYNQLLKGATNGKFYPEGYISGTDVLVGMLRALGYDHNDELVGAGYVAAAQQTAYQVGLNRTVRLATLMGNATREQIAQLAYDTLITPTLIWNPISTGGYQGNNDYYEKNGPTLGYKVFDLEVIEREDATGAANPDYTALKLEEDPFGRPDPLYVVLLEGEIIYEGRKVVASYSGANSLTGKEAQTYLNAVSRGKADMTVYYNGLEADATNAAQGDGVPHFRAYDFSGGVTAGMWLDDDTGINGYEIDIYDNTTESDTKTQYVVVCREAWVAQVGETDENDDSIDLTVYEGSDPTSGSKKTFTVEKTDDLYKSVAAFDEDDFVAVYINSAAGSFMNYDSSTDSADDYIISVHEMTPVETTITRFNEDKGGLEIKSSVVAGGNTYYFANEALLASGVGNDATVDRIFNGLETGAATLYLYNNLVLLVDQTADNKEGYAYLYDVWIPGSDTTGSVTPGDWWGNPEAEAPEDGSANESGGSRRLVKMYLSDGNHYELYARDKSGTPIADLVARNSDEDGTTYANKGILVYYKINPADDVYELYKINGKTQTEASTGKLEVKSGVAKGKIPGNMSSGINVEFDSKTVFFIVDAEGDSSTLEQPGAVRVFTNIDNISNLTGEDNDWVAAAKATSSTNSTGTTVTADNDIVTALLWETPAVNVTSGSYFVVPGNAKLVHEIVNGKTVYFYEYAAVVDGKITTVKVRSDDTGDTSRVDAKAEADGIVFVKNVTWSATYDDTILAFGTPMTDDTTHVKKITESVAKSGDGNLIIDDSDPYRVKEGLSIFVYDLTTGKITSTTVSKITASDYQSGYYVLNNDGVLTALYLCKGAAILSDDTSVTAAISGTVTGAKGTISVDFEDGKITFKSDNEGDEDAIVENTTVKVVLTAARGAGIGETDDVDACTSNTVELTVTLATAANSCTVSPTGPLYVYAEDGQAKATLTLSFEYGDNFAVISE